MDDERLSQPRHCITGVQPMPKAVHCSGCHDKQLPMVGFDPATCQPGMLLPLLHNIKRTLFNFISSNNTATLTATNGTMT